MGKESSRRAKESRRRKKEIEVLELDEMCISFKKNIWLWTAVDRESKKLLGYDVGTRETKYFEKLSIKISRIEPKNMPQTNMKHII